MVDDPVRERFKEIVRRIDRVSKAGRHRRAFEMLPELMAVRPEAPLFSKKKSHFIAALAFRAFRAGEHDTAVDLLDLADREIPDDHMIPVLREERANVREAATAAMRTAKTAR